MKEGKIVDVTFCVVISSNLLQGMRSRWKDYARRVLQWQKASNRGSKGSPEVSGDAHESLKEKVLLQQQHSLDVKQMKEVLISLHSY